MSGTRLERLEESLLIGCEEEDVYGRTCALVWLPTKRKENGSIQVGRGVKEGERRTNW